MDSGDCRRARLRPRLSEAGARRLADRLAAVADPTRLRLLDLLARHEPEGAAGVCVCELVDAVRLAQPTVSHHLRVLRAAGLVDYRKRGVWAYYHIRREACRELRAQLDGLLGPVPPRPTEGIEVG